MKLEIRRGILDKELYYIDLKIDNDIICTEATLDEIETIESQLTDLVLQLYDYRKKQGIK